MFIIQEIQTDEYGVVAFLPAEQKTTREAAESTFYYKCGSAVVSSVPIHTIITYTEEGFTIPELTKCFKHPPVNTEEVSE